MREVVYPCAVDVLFVIVEEKTLPLQEVVVPVIAADELVGFCYIDYAEVCTGLLLLVNMALIYSITVID